MKRLFDFFFSLTVLIILSPAYLAIAMLVRWKLGAPIHFCQQRPGLRGRPFLLLKFRSMTDARAANGTLMPDSERLTEFGRFLRASSLDELPGLINVLRGDMSLIGPRPLLMQYLPLYNECQRRRHEVRPGITGWAQVNGRNALSWEEKFEHDVWYVDNRSTLLDLKILFLTVTKVLRRDGISANGDVTMPVFTGSEPRQ